MTGFLKNIYSFFGKWANAIWLVLCKSYETVSSFTSSIAGKILNFFKQIPAQVKSFFVHMWSYILYFFTFVGNSTKHTITSAYSAMKNALKHIITSFSSGGAAPSASA